MDTVGIERLEEMRDALSAPGVGAAVLAGRDLQDVRDVVSELLALKLERRSEALSRLAESDADLI